MTLHVLLRPSAPNSLVWLTDTQATLGFGNSAHIEKIIHLKNRAAACSSWGDHAFALRDVLVQGIQENTLDLSTPDSVLSSLWNLILDFNQHRIPILGKPRGIPGIVLASFANGNPAVYVGLVGQQLPIVAAVIHLWAGDEDNPAKVFVEYYYERSKKTIEDALLLGIHSMRIAHCLKREYIGEPVAWVYRDGDFRRLGNRELTDYIDRSELLDGAVLNTGAKAARESPQ